VKLQPKHLKRYKDVALLLLKHGSQKIIEEAELGEQFGFKPSGRAGADELAADLEKLGPTFVKLGQILSTRGDLLPPAYLKALSRLQDDVEPVPFETIHEIVEGELGVRISKAFKSFESKPYASASLGQVHRAELHSGKKVAIKIQRPHLRKTIIGDLESFSAIAQFMDEHTKLGRRYEFARIVDQFRVTLMAELDYLREAANLRELKENLADYKHLIIPGVVEDFTTSKVLTMDYIEGAKLTELSGAVKIDIDGVMLADELFAAYLQQVLVDGFFHADPHPGNLLLTHDNKIAVLDLGMTGRIHQRLRDNLIRLLAGVSEGDGVEAAEAALHIGEPRGDNMNRTQFISEIETIVGENKSANLSKMEMGKLVLDVTKACANCGLRIPKEISMLGKMLMNLDRIGYELDPDFNPAGAIRKHMREISRKRIKQTLTSANVMGMLTEGKEFLGQLPSRLNRIVELAADNRLRLKVHAIDEELLLNGFQKIANRITVGLILAAMIVGAALLSQVETDSTLFGYPTLAMILFLFAVAGGIVLTLSIVFKDHREHRDHDKQFKE